MRIFSALDMQFPPQSICLALGLFNGLHPGHIAVIRSAVERAKELRKLPCVFTFTTHDSSPASKSRGDLLSPSMFEDRLTQLGIEHAVRPDFSAFKDMSPEDFVTKIIRGRLGAASVSCGENFRFGKDAAGDVSTLTSLLGDIELHVVPMVERDGVRISSSQIRAALRDGDVEMANLLLGRRFAIDFEVIHGRQLGRTLGSPTINQPFPEGFMEPKFGVYATVTHLSGQSYASVTNVGVKPTVGSDGVLAETYIHGFSGNLYGRSVLVEFLKFIRPERKFTDIAALQDQIALDSQAAEKIAGELVGGFD